MTHELKHSDIEHALRSKFSDGIRAGMLAGNIHVASENESLTIQSQAAMEALRQHERTIQTIEKKYMKNSLRIPTEDTEVKDRLRRLQKPICLFGENAALRRDRLRTVIADFISRGQPLPDFMDKTARPVISADLVHQINKNRPILRKPEIPDLKKCRIRMLEFSMERAAKRVKIQRQAREHPLTNTQRRQEFDRLKSYLEDFAVQGSQIVETRPLSSVSVGPDNDKIVCGAFSGACRIYSVNGGTLLREFQTAHTGRVCGVAFRSVRGEENNPLVISTSSDSTFAIWRLLSGEVAYRSNFHTERVNAAKFHPLGNYFATASYDKKWCLWDLEKLQTKRSGDSTAPSDQAPLLCQDGHSREIHALDFHPDGSLVATGDCGGIIRLWDCRSGSAIAGLDRHIKPVLSTQFSPNGYVLASASQDHTVKIWDLRKQNDYTIAAHMNVVVGAKFEPVNGDYLVTASFDKQIKLWTAKHKKWVLAQKLTGHEDHITDLDVSPNGKFIVSVSRDRTWKLWAPDETDPDGMGRYLDVPLERKDDDEDVVMME